MVMILYIHCSIGVFDASAMLLEIGQPVLEKKIFERFLGVAAIMKPGLFIYTLSAFVHIRRTLDCLL